MKVESYLNFDGRTEEALNFYKKALGAEVLMMLRFKECPDQKPGMFPPGSENKVLHSAFRIGETTLMASDCGAQGKASFQGISLSITVPTEKDADKLFAALGDGGKVQMPLTKTFFSPRFGVVADRFGVSWMVHVPGQQ